MPYSSLAKQNMHRLPQPGTIIASSFTSPIDCLYLAAIFDPIFTASYPSTRLVQRISLFQAILRALAPPQSTAPYNARLVPLSTLLRDNPDSSIVVLPECTTTNGRGILRFGPPLITAPPKTKIFPVSLRYTPSDITTPIPRTYFSFLWNLCSRPTHCIRVRIAEAVYNASASPTVRPEPPKAKNSYDTNFFDELGLGEKTASSSDTLTASSDDGEGLNMHERKVLDRVAEDLARLGRVKRVGLGVKEKEEFVRAWTTKRK